ncbi:MAG TPA: S-layer homology domain-containing protein [Chloroflexia bacterium]
MFRNPFSAGRRGRVFWLGVLLTSVAAVSWLLQAQQTASPSTSVAPRLSRPSGSLPASLYTGQNAPPVEKRYPNGVRVVQEVKHDSSPPLRDIPARPPQPRQGEAPENPNPFPMNSEPVEDTAVQRFFGPLSMVTPTLTFEGISSSTSGCGCLPPDTNGAVGPNHYIQTVNSAFQIWNKNGTVAKAVADINTIFTGFGNTCEALNDGDPIVLYDKLADRWFINQFTSTAPPYSQCTAISKTGDPTGAYWRYQFALSNTDFYDYQKYGIWPDGYYMTANVFGPTGSFSRPSMIAFDRAKMLNGETATYQEFNPGNFYASILPSDMDGATPPPVGSPNYLATLAGSNDRFRLWKFHVDWATPASSSLTGPINLTTAPYDPNLCGNGPCVPQPNTTQKLDTLGDHTMYRLAYRNMGTYETLVTNHTVDVGGDRAAIRWYEVRNPNTSPFIYQQGTYAPDAVHRWMGSAAMDKDGNIAIGYSASSSSVFPSIRYAGRLASDPLGVLGQGEATLMAGGGSQTHSSGRWGDYSGMVVDPTDDCTFWYTTEYYSATSSSSWKTRIGKFKFPSCGQAAPTATGTPPTATPTTPPTMTPLPTVVSCSNYTYTTTLTGTLVPGTTDTGNHCDDCSVPITLPFPVNLYDGTFTNATLSSNGNMQFVTTDFAFGNACLPVPIFEYGVVAYWDDIITDCEDCGIFTSVSGTAPNRILNVEWRAEVLGEANTEANFEIRLYEGQTRFDLVYGNVVQAGNGATIGVQRDIGAATQFSCNTVGILPNSSISFTLPPCGPGTATPTITSTSIVTSTATLTTTGTPTSTSVVTSTTTPLATLTTTGTATQAVTATNTTIVGASATTTATATASRTSTRTATPVASSTRPSTPIPTTTVGATATVTACAIQFQDVPPSNDVSSFYPYVRCLACRGVLGGYPCGGTNSQTGAAEPCGATSNPYFRPNNLITRAQISKIVSNAAGFDDDVEGQTYADVPPSDDPSSFYVYIERLTLRNVMGGYPCDVAPGEPCSGDNRAYFRPGANATRAQLAKIVSNAAGYVENVEGQTFADVPPPAQENDPSSFYLFVERLAQRGVLSGYPCGGPGEECDDQDRPYFRPSSHVTRAQAAKIVANTFYPNCQTP